jgi:hypothetical protein
MAIACASCLTEFSWCSSRSRPYLPPASIGYEIIASPPVCKTSGFYHSFESAAAAELLPFKKLRDYQKRNHRVDEVTEQELTVH